MRNFNLSLRLGALWVAIGWLSMAPAVAQNAFNQWIPVGEGTGIDPDSYYQDIASTAAPEAIYVALSDPYHQPRALAKVLMWDGTLWRSLPNIDFGTTWGLVHDLAWHNGELYACGAFDSVNHVPGSKGIIKFDGDQWVAVGGGITGGPLGSEIRTMAIFDGQLFIGGYFQHIGGIPVNHFASWDGTSWLAPAVQPDDQVNDLFATPTDLYATGRFQSVGALNVGQVARFDGSQWHTMGLGLTGGTVGPQVIREFLGNVFVYGFSLTNAGGSVVITDKIARWDGSAWHNLSLPIPNGYTNTVWDMREFEGKVWIDGAFYDPANFRYLNFLAWNPPAAGVLDSVPQSRLGEINAYDLLLWQDKLFAVGDLGFERDYVLQWCSDRDCGVIEGFVYHDLDGDCMFDWATEEKLSGRKIRIEPGNRWVVADRFGKYQAVLQAGQTYTVSLQPRSYWETLCPAYPFVIPLDTGEHSRENNFFTRIDPAAQEVSVELNGGFGIPSVHGLSVNMTVRNHGSVLVGNATLSLKHDHIPEILKFSVNPDQQINDSIVWALSNLNPGEERNLRVLFRVPPPGPTGDTTTWIARIMPSNGDADPNNNLDTLHQVVINAHDPNDKQVWPQGDGVKGEIFAEDTVFTYRLRFQNIGTDTARNVYLVDTLDSDFQLGSLEILGATHDYRYAIGEDRALIFYFDNINLPDSNVNEPESHGNISYRIISHAGLPLGTEFTNRADIYFDYQPPVATNTTLNTLTESEALEPMMDFVSQLYPNPMRERATLSWEQTQPLLTRVYLLNLQGQMVRQWETERTSILLERNELPAGLYFYLLVNEKGKGSGKLLMVD